MEKTLGLRVIYQPDNPSEAVVDIVFVHGLDGDSFTTWFEQTKSSYWPRDFLAHDIPQSRILTFGYIADWASFGKGWLSGNASDLLHDLCSLRSLPENVSIICSILLPNFAGDFSHCTSYKLSFHQPYRLCARRYLSHDGAL